MPRDFTTIPPETVTRKDRAVTDEAWIKSLLHRAPVGIIATVHDGQPFINTNLFVYDEPANALYMHTAKVGRTRSNVETDERVCFSVTEIGRLLPYDAAVDFSVEYSGVVIFGRAGIIEDPDAARDALQKLLDKYAPHLTPGRDYRPPTPDEVRRTSVYRIRIDTWSGKKKQAPPDFPGAYVYETLVSAPPSPASAPEDIDA